MRFCSASFCPRPCRECVSHLTLPQPQPRTLCLLLPGLCPDCHPSHIYWSITRLPAQGHLLISPSGPPHKLLKGLRAPVEQAVLFWSHREVRTGYRVVLAPPRPHLCRICRGGVEHTVRFGFEIRQIDSNPALPSHGCSCVALDKLLHLSG